MRRFARMFCACASFVLTGVAAPAVVAEPLPTPAARDAAVVRLGVLHHIAQREIALGLLAQVAAVRPQTMTFATALETDFRLLDRRILAIAGALNIDEDQLQQAYAEGHTTALDRQADDLDHLSVLRGVDFDRQFWVTVARDHRAASEMLASPARTVPSVDTVVDETARLIKRSIRNAAAAQAATNAPRPH
jgi:hypothetical protein